MKYDFDTDGLIGPQQLKKAINTFLEDHGRLRMTERMQTIVREYISGSTVETIAKKMNVTRERIRQILTKAQRQLGIKAPPAEVYIYGALSLEEWMDHKQMGDLRDQLKTHLGVYGIEGEDNDSLTRLFFISLRNYFQDKSFMYEHEED